MLVDIFSEDYGRICCVARPAKKRGKIVKGNLEPFRYLNIQWIGKGDVQTLTEADERGRHNVPPSEMLLGLYLNELLLLLTRQHVVLPDIFKAYKYTLHKLSDPLINKQIVMRFELYLLQSLGYPIQLPNEQASEQGSEQDKQQSNKQITGEISNKIRYRFIENEGLVRYLGNTNTSGVISNKLLIAIENLAEMEDTQWHELRLFLDSVFKQLAPKQIHSRRLISF